MNTNSEKKTMIQSERYYGAMKWVAAGYNNIHI